MSLPIVLEIAVGLIFIYLTLSLVASEIQEILSALFQWRAEHLKRSIEQLLAGDGLASRTPTAASRQLSQSSQPHDRTGNRLEDKRSDRSHTHQNRRAARALANELYDSPLIENLNYEAQGRITSLFRRLLHGVGALYRVVTFSRNVFGHKTSGPSYIPAETFATSLIDRLRLKDFQQLLVRSRFGEFLHNDVRLPLHNIVNELRASLDNEELLVAEMAYFDQSLSQISDDLDIRRLTLEEALLQVDSQLQAFETMVTEAPEALANEPSFDELSERMKEDLLSVGTAVEASLADYPLPIGRTQTVLEAQQQAQQDWPIPYIPQRLVGWAITALALSMGASFWFDVLRKFTSVRTSGNPPKS